jgi:hypothetical protein
MQDPGNDWIEQPEPTPLYEEQLQVEEDPNFDPNATGN